MMHDDQHDGHGFLVGKPERDGDAPATLAIFQGGPDVKHLVPEKAEGERGQGKGEPAEPKGGDGHDNAEQAREGHAHEHGQQPGKSNAVHEQTGQQRRTGHEGGLGQADHSADAGDDGVREEDDGQRQDPRWPELRSRRWPGPR